MIILHFFFFFIAISSRNEAKNCIFADILVRIPMLQDILSAIPLGVFLAFTIGPVFFVLLETSILKGFRAALVFDFGVILGDVFFILVAYFATNNLLQKIKDDPRLFVFGGMLLFVYGIFSYLKQRHDFQKRINTDLCNLSLARVNYLNLFVKGFLLNAINIGVLGFWLGIIIVFTPRLDMDSSRILIFFSAIIVVYLLVDLVKILIAKQLRHRLNPKNIHQIKQSISIILIIFGLILTLQGIFPKEKEMIKQKIEEIL